jgi:integrase
MESSIRAHLIPVLGDVPLTALDTRRIQELIKSMEGRNRKTVINCVGDLFSILSAARKWNHKVPEVKWGDLFFPTEGLRDPAFLQPGQVKAILAEVSGRYPWEMFFELLADTGLRTGEILGLRVCDLDFKHRVITLHQSIWGGEMQTMKTVGSAVPIPMTPAIAKKLKLYLVGHTAELLFVNKIGRPLDGNKIVQRVLHPILDKLGIVRKGRRIGLHAFRHFLASMLMRGSGGPKVAQAQLRHSDPRTTDIYGHVIGRDHRRALARIHQAVSSGTRKK